MKHLTSKKYLKFWIPGIFVFGIIFYFATNPLRYSEETIRSQILSNTPLGTSMEEVESYIQSEDWEIVYKSEINGFYDQRTRPAREVGSKSIRASLGDYYNPLSVNVTVFWGFNGQSKLIDIWVWKSVDSL